MLRNPRYLLATIVAFSVLLSTCAFGQSIFDSQPAVPSRPAAKAPSGPSQQVAAAAQQHFAKAVRFQKAGKPDAAIAELQIVKKLMPKQPAVYMNLGLCYMQKQDAPNAESAFRQVIAIDPKNQFAQSQLARLLLGRGKDAEALSFAKKAVAANPKDFNAQFVLGVVCLKSKNYLRAAPAFQAALAIRPGDTACLYNLGYCQLNARKYADSRRTYEKLLKIMPEDPKIHVLAGMACEQMGDKAAAISHFDRAAWKSSPVSTTAVMGLVRLYSLTGKIDKATDTLKRAAGIYKEDYEINISYGRMLYGKKNYKDAEQYFVAAKKTNPDAFANMNLAMNASNLGKMDVAEACAKAAYKMDPKNKQAIDVYVYVMQNQRKEAEAISACRKWEQYYPQDTTPNTRIAGIYQSQGKNDLASAEFAKAMKKNPKDVGLMVSAAVCLRTASKLDDAVKLLQKATTVDAKNETAFQILADTYEQQKKTDLAIEQYKKILAFNPKSDGALRRLATVYDTKGDFAAEIDTYRKICALNPKDTLAPRSIPRLYDKMGQLDTAIAESKKLVDASPKDNDARVQYGDLLGKKKDWTGAIAQYTELTKGENAQQKSRGYFLIGGAQEKMDKPDDAIASYKKCLEGMPSYRVALDSLGKIYEAKKQPEEFHSFLKSSVETGKENAPYLYFRDTFKKAGKADEALKTLEGLGQKFPENVAISSVLADAYTDAGAKDKAIELYKKLLAKDKNLAWVNRSLGDLYASTDRNEEAASCYAEVLKSMPFDSTLQKKLGGLYEKLGKKAEAIAAYKAALQFSPQDREATDAVDKLEGRKPGEKAPEAPKASQTQPAVISVPIQVGK